MKFISRVLIFLCIILISIMTTVSYASDSNKLSWDNIQRKSNTFFARGSSGTSLINASDMQPVVMGFANILTTIGAVIVLIRFPYYRNKIYGGKSR
ncbi:MAG: hypothetical protein IKP28_01860 [Clostridia bacterium]|nr:hypothetical protein [Clostridia bacterium]